MFKRTSLLVYPHGATMTHAMFLPRGAVAMEVIQWPNVTEPHGWLQVNLPSFAAGQPVQPCRHRRGPCQRPANN